MNRWQYFFDIGQFLGNTEPDGPENFEKAGRQFK